MEPVSSLCTTQHPTNIMTGVVVRLLQEHFARADNLIYTEELDGSKQLEGYIWDPDNKVTKIQIQPVHQYNAQDIQRRPAIYVKRNAWKPHRVAINHGQTINAKPTEDGRIERVRGEYHSQAVLGSHSIFCVGKTGAEAELLGSEVFDYFISFAPIMRKDLKLHRLEVEEIGGIKTIDEEVEHFVVPITLAYAFFWTWRLEAVAPWLQKFSIDMRST